MLTLKKFDTLIGITILSFLLSGCTGPKIKTVASEQNSIQRAASEKRSREIKHEKKEEQKAWNAQLKAEKEIEDKLGNLNYQSNENPIVKINKGASTLNVKEWEKSIVLFQKKDKQKRTSHMTTAYIDKKNLTTSVTPKITINPEGYQTVNDDQHHPVLVKSNIIDSTLLKGIQKNGIYSSKQKKVITNNSSNVFTVTSYCRNTLMQPYIKQIQDALKANAKVVIQVMPVFYHSDKLCKGVWLQARGTNGLNFNVFVFNVQPGYQINYQTGKVIPNKSIQIAKPQF